MNSYFDLAPPMLSRFIRIFFHHMKRVDRELAAVVNSNSDDERHMHTVVKNLFRHLYYRQMQLDMLQYCGIINRPSTVGWQFFARQFEQTLRKNYPGLVGADFMRVMEDAETLLHCFMNFYAVFMVFAHESSPVIKEKKFRYDMFLECEKYLVPSDAACELVMSMMEEAFFSTSERQVMMSIKEGFFPLLKHGVPHEKSIKAVRRDYERERKTIRPVSAADEEEDEDPEDGEAEPPAEPPGSPGHANPPTAPSGSGTRLTKSPWRADSVNKIEDCGKVGKLRFIKGDCEKDSGGVLTRESQKEWEEARRHVVAYTGKARDKEGILDRFSLEVERHMAELCRNSNYEKMSPDHIKGALKDLTDRCFSEDGYSQAASVIYICHKPDEMVMAGERTFYVLVLKQYLDMLEHNEMCMKAVFGKMRHGLTIPGTRLLSSPFRCPGSKHMLPQFADAYEVPYHSKTCAALPPKNCADTHPQKVKWDTYIKRVTESFAAQGMSYDSMCVCADQTLLHEVGCNCFRSLPCAMVKGSRLGPSQRLAMEQQMNTNLSTAGIRDLEFVQLLRPTEDLAFEEFLTHTLRWTASRIRDQDGRYTTEAQRYHPSLSAVIAVDKAHVEDLGDRCYPVTFVKKYLQGLKVMLDRSCNLITAASAVDTEETRSMRRLGMQVLPQEEVQVLSQMRTHMLNKYKELNMTERQWLDDFANPVSTTLSNELLPRFGGSKAYDHVRMMSDSHRRAWLKIDATPVAAVETLLRNLMSSVQHSMNKVASESKRLQRSGR